MCEVCDKAFSVVVIATNNTIKNYITERNKLNTIVSGILVMKYVLLCGQSIFNLYNNMCQKYRQASTAENLRQFTQTSTLLCNIYFLYTTYRITLSVYCDRRNDTMEMLALLALFGFNRFRRRKDRDRQKAEQE